ncbi:hypothetical protein VTH82DRAFT_5017 [Thermothelomyces myriococcoides]
MDTTKDDRPSLASRLEKRYREKMQGLLPEPPKLIRPDSRSGLYNFELARKLLDEGGQVISEKVNCWLVKHPCGTKVTKFCSRGVRPSEVGAMRFVSEHTSIPVPRVYDVGGRHLTMEFVEGETLDDAWRGGVLSAQDQALVCRQLGDYFGQLRAFKSPDGLICSFGGLPAVDARRRVRREGGPFAGEAAYNEFLLSGLVGHPVVRDMVRAQMRADHEIVLSHGDLHSVNILVRPGVGVVAIVDWELAGYYPEYLDPLAPLRSPNWLCGYYGELPNLFPQRYNAEFMVDQVLTSWSKY